MKQARSFPRLTVTKKGEAAVVGGHPWVYASDLSAPPDENIENGCLADVVSQRGAYLGTGFFSRKSKIAVRIISDNANETFDAGFFSRRVRYAIEYRDIVLHEAPDCCRLIFGEADGFPGLTVDRFDDVLVAQVLSFGMDKVKHGIYAELIRLLDKKGVRIRGIFERNESSTRELEGLPMCKGWYDGLPHLGDTSCEITENGIRYYVDFENGQKTGFFLDQKYNRKAVSGFARGRRVLDCFTHTGSFALNAAYGGAEHVAAADISETAIEQAKRNAELNGLNEKIDFICEDIFELLPRLCANRKDGYDFIILDPPAFTKSRRTIADAERGYKEINMRAMKLLPRGGLLATCSCSHFMSDELFRKMLASAARDAGVQLKQIEAHAQSPDHPVLWNVPETAYLKFYIFQVV